MARPRPAAEEDVLRRLCRDAAMHTVRRVPFGDLVAAPLQFYRDYVAQRRPCVITDCADRWPAAELWSGEYLAGKMGDRKVTVAATPNGRADALTEVAGEVLFMRPAEREMAFVDFIDGLRRQRQGPPAPVLYAQKQNDSFREEFAPLRGDVPDDLAQVGEHIFGGPPEAVNLWMGTDATTSSMHKDPYENLYAVVRGSKKFTILPPWEAGCVPYTKHPEGVWVEDESSPTGFSSKKLGSSVRWVALDPHDPEASVKHPRWAHAHPLHISVDAGEVLYLPSLWFHEVSQVGDDEGHVIAVNYWFDMAYDTSFWLLEATRRLADLVDSGDISSDEDE